MSHLQLNANDDVIDRRITIGNILTVLAMLGSMFAITVKLTIAIDSVETRIALIEYRLDQMDMKLGINPPSIREH